MAVAEAKKNADSAYIAVCELRDAIANTREAEISEAHLSREKAEITAAEEWRLIEGDIRARADQAVEEVAERLANRRVELSEARRAAGAIQDDAEKAVQSARAAFVVAAAHAGVAADELDEHATAEVLLQRLPRAASGMGNSPEEYLDPHATLESEKPSTDKPPQKPWVRPVVAIWQGFRRSLPGMMKTACLLVFGAIFGMSLGLLFNAFTFKAFKDTEIFARSLLALLGFFGIGVGVFYAMGQGLHHVTVLTVEGWGRWRRGIRSVWTPILATILCVFVVVGFVALEATIERFGLVDSYIREQKTDLSKNVAQIEEEAAKKEWAYTAIALVAALPFVVLHVSLAVREAQGRVASASRRANEAESEQNWLTRPEVCELLAAHGEWKRMNAAQMRDNAENSARVEQARLRVEEAEAEQESHPNIFRFADLENERREFFEEHTGRRVAHLRWDRLQSELDAEPTLWAARQRYEYFRSKEAAHNDWLARNLRETGATVVESLAQRFADTAASTVDTLADRVVRETPFATAAEALSTAQDIAGELVFSAGNQVRDSLPISFREQALNTRLTEAKAQQENDPQVTYLRERIHSLQSRLSRMEDGYKKRITSLKKQRRAIELRPGVYLPVEMGNAETQLQAAQALFEKEYAKLVRLQELPRLIRWFTHIHQVWLQPDVVITQVETATRERALIAVPPTPGPVAED